MTNPTRPISWHALQIALRECQTEEQVEALINAEVNGLRRKRWLLRMNSRRSVLRSERELREINRLVGETANGD